MPLDPRIGLMFNPTQYVDPASLIAISQIQDKRNAANWQWTQDVANQAIQDGVAAYESTPGSNEQKQAAAQKARNDRLIKNWTSGMGAQHGWTEASYNKAVGTPYNHAMAMFRVFGPEKAEKILSRGQAISAADAAVPKRESSLADINKPRNVMQHNEVVPGIAEEGQPPPINQPATETSLGPPPEGTTDTGQRAMGRVGGKEVPMGPVGPNIPTENTATDYRRRAQEMRARGDAAKPFNDPVSESYYKQGKQLDEEADRQDRLEDMRARTALMEGREKLKEQEKTLAMPDGEAMGTYAARRLFTGERLSGWGRLGIPRQNAVEAMAARMGHGMGLTDAEIALLPKQNNIKLKAIDGLTKWSANVGRLQEELGLDLNNVIKYAQNIDPGQLQSINKAIMRGQMEFNDPMINAYAIAVQTVKGKYERVITGPTSNAMMPVEAMKKGDQLISMGQNVDSWKEVSRIMMADANSTMISANDMIKGLNDSMMSGGKSTPFTPQQIPQSQSGGPNLNVNPSKGHHPQMQIDPNQPKPGDLREGRNGIIYRWVGPKNPTDDQRRDKKNWEAIK